MLEFESFSLEAEAIESFSFSLVLSSLLLAPIPFSLFLILNGKATFVFVFVPPPPPPPSGVVGLTGNPDPKVGADEDSGFGGSRFVGLSGREKGVEVDGDENVGGIGGGAPTPSIAATGSSSSNSPSSGPSSSLLVLPLPLCGWVREAISEFHALPSVAIRGPRSRLVAAPAGERECFRFLGFGFSCVFDSVLLFIASSLPVYSGAPILSPFLGQNPSPNLNSRKQRVVT